MQKKMMFNPSSLEQREVLPQDAKKLEEAGWVPLGGSNVLVHMYHPGLNLHKNVLKSDQKTWESKGYLAEPTMIFSPTEGRKVVPAERAKELVGKGWYDSPADFPAKPTPVASAPLIAPSATTLEKPNDKMTKTAIILSAFAHYGLVLDETLTKVQMLAEVDKLVEGTAPKEAA